MRIIKSFIVIVLVIFGFYEFKYGSVSDILEAYKPRSNGYQVVQSKVTSTLTQNASSKADAAQKAYNQGDRSTGDRLTNEAFAELDHAGCVVRRNCGAISSSAPVAQTSQQSVAQAQAAIVVHDPSYESIGNRPFQVLQSDLGSGEHNFLLDARVVNQVLPVVPAAGETWSFSFSYVSVCAWGVRPTDATGQTEHRKPGEVMGSDRTRYNADDFPAQTAYQQEAVAYTGEGILELGNPYTWVVTDSAAGKNIAVGFNIRRSEASQAHGVGILTIKITK